MNKIKIKHGDWIVVCDGRKALILENVGDMKFPNLRTKEMSEHHDSSTHELGVSPPGRSHRSMGHARSAVAQTDWHDEAERTFLHTLADRLDRAVAGGETQRLAIIAAPRALGMIRKAYSPALRKAIDIELEKDLVKMPVYEIEKHLFSGN